MTRYVHITDECRTEAQDLGLESRLSKIKEQIETAQNLSGFDFLSATVIKKKIGRPFRLIARLHAVADDELIIFVRLLQRRRVDYPHQLEVIKGTLPYSDDEFRRIYSQLTTAPVPSRPVPSADECAWLNEVRQETSPTNDTFVFETRSWVTKMRRNQLAPLYHKVLENMADTTQLTAATPHAHWLDDIGIAYHYRSDLDCLLLLEPLRAGQPIDIHEYERRLSRANDRTDISRLAARSYPLLVVLDRDAWLAIQTDEESNLALSPEEAQIIEDVQTTETGTNIAYPLFINGHAGSGKSTILQYLASAYVDFSLRRDTHRFPIYLTASDDLLTRARQIVKGLLTTNYERVLEDEIDPNAIDRLLDKSFQTFHQLLYSLLPSERKSSLRNDRYVNYASFRRLWHDKFATHREARQLSVEVSWHVIRSLIKGIRSDCDDELEPEDFKDLPRRRRSVSSEEYEKVYRLVWRGWYKPMCEQDGYWDDQDLAAYVLGDGASSSDHYAAIFCDEAQDFTSVELDVIFQLSLYSRRTLHPHELRRVPMIFAGDPLQTINPTGFRWDAVKADFHDRFRATIEARSQSNIEMSYRVLHLNYRSNSGIVRFCNLIQLVRATLLDRTDIRPQGYWWLEDSVSTPTWFMVEDPITECHLRDHPEFVKLIDCHEGEESEYVKRDPMLLATLDQSEGTYSNVMCPTRAKGLEFSVVVLYRFGERMAGYFDRLLHRQVDLKDDPGSRLQWEYFFSRLYVAASRARDRLIIVDSKEGIERFWKFAIDPEGHDNLDSALQSSTWSEQWAPLARGGPEAWDTGQHIDERAQAEQYAAQGRRDADSYLLKQAASSFRRVNDDYQARECIAQAAEVDENWEVAGARYCDLHLHENAFNCYWKGKLWRRLEQLASRENYVSRLESRAADFMASGDVPPRSFLGQLISAINDESRLQEIASDHTWHTVLASVADRVAQLAADNINISIRWSDVFEAFERLAHEGVRLSRSSRAAFAYRSKDFERAETLWRADKQVQSTEYKRSKAWITPFPDSLELFKQLGDHAEILRQWSQNHPSDAMIRTLHPSIAYTVADAALDQGKLTITATMMQAHPHPGRVGKLLVAAIKARDDSIVYRGVIAAIRLFVQAKSWNDVVDATSLRSIGKLAGIPVVDIRAALNRIGKSSVILETIVRELATSKALADSAPKVVATFLQKRFISGDGTIGTDIPERVVGAAIERSGRIVDALQYYEDLLQREDGPYDIRSFAAERLIRNLERHAGYMERTDNQQQARKQRERSEQLRKSWNIKDSDLDDYPTVRTQREDRAGYSIPDETDNSFWNSPDLDELLHSQNVEPLSDIRELYGTWPGDESDNFEAEIDSLRHSDYGHEDP